MKKAINMKFEQSKSDYDPAHTAVYHFDDALKRAIENGNGRLICAAVKQQSPNDVTESISNHLQVRSFLVQQKEKLVALDRTVARAEDVRDVIIFVDNYVLQLEMEFNDRFVAEEAEYAYAKLSGDRLFREALSLQSTNLTLVARHFAKIDLSALQAPDEVFREIDDLEDFIATSLIDVVGNIEEKGMGLQMLIGLRDVITQQVETIDEVLLNNLPVVTRSD